MPSLSPLSSIDFETFSFKVLWDWISKKWNFAVLMFIAVFPCHISFNLSNVGEYFSGVILYRGLKIELCLRPPIKKCHVIVVQRRQRNVQKARWTRYIFHLLIVNIYSFTQEHRPGCPVPIFSYFLSLFLFSHI